MGCWTGMGLRLHLRTSNLSLSGIRLGSLVLGSEILIGGVLFNK